MIIYKSSLEYLNKNKEQTQYNLCLCRQQHAVSRSLTYHLGLVGMRCHAQKWLSTSHYAVSGIPSEERIQPMNVSTTFQSYFPDWRIGLYPYAGSSSQFLFHRYVFYIWLLTWRLYIYRQAKEMASSIQNRVLGLPIGDTIFGKTCLIVGYGNIAKELAPRWASVKHASGFAKQQRLNILLYTHWTRLLAPDPLPSIILMSSE